MIRIARTLLLAALATSVGCSFGGQAHGDGDGDGDAGGDAGSGLCLEQANGVSLAGRQPTQALELPAGSSYTLDLAGFDASGPLTLVDDNGSNDITLDFELYAMPGGGDAALLVVSKVDLAAASKLRVLGASSDGDESSPTIVAAPPLIVASTGPVTIEGVIDARGGCRGGDPTNCGGPGAGTGTVISNVEPDPASCSPGENGSGATGTTPEQGGGGGGFGGAGAAGGGDNAGGGGDACGELTLEPLRGGSAGGAGGIGSNGGDGGGGGGGIQIASAVSISIGVASVAGINAGGGPGAGPNPGGTSVAGGGGGSGGGILLEAPSIELGSMAVLAANGGGGGAGGDDTADTGTAGKLDDSAAPGGQSGVQPGGAGAFAAVAAEPGGGTGNDDDTGGGGGGVGVIVLRVEAAALSDSGVTTPAAAMGQACALTE